MDQTHASSPLAGAVHDLATEVVLALRSGDHLATVCGAAGIDEENRTGIAAARVIGADLLLPSVLYGRHPHPGDVAVLDRAVREFPPKPDAPAATAWSHWHMISTLQRFAPPPQGATGPGTTVGTGTTGTYAEPDAAWLENAPWQSFTHQLSVLAPSPYRPPPRPCSGPRRTGRSTSHAASSARCGGATGSRRRARAAGSRRSAVNRRPWAWSAASTSSS